MSACVYLKGQKSSTCVGGGGTLGCQRGTHLHADFGVTHATIHRQVIQLLPTIEFHGIQNSFSLEANSFERCACDMSTLGVMGDTNCR
jgi:hypothetical protein